MRDFTPDVTEQVEKYAAEGLPINLIADLIEVPRRTFTEWMTKGDAGEEPFDRVSRIIRRHRAEWGRERWNVAGEGAKNSGCAQWQLEKVYPEDFGNRTSVAVEHSGQLAVVDWRSAPLDEVLAAAGLGPKG